MKKICYLLMMSVSLLFLGSCMEDIELYPDRYEKILCLKENGIVKCSMISTWDTYDEKVLHVLKGGGKPESRAVARLELMSVPEVCESFGYGQSSLELLSDDTYSVDLETEIVIDAEERSRTIPVNFYPKKIYEQQKASPDKMLVLPLRLVSVTDTVNTDADKVLYMIEVKGPEDEIQLAVANKIGWKVAYCNSQLYEKDKWYANAGKMIDGNVDTDWVANYNTDVPVVDDYDYEDESHLRDQVGEAHAFLGSRALGDIIVVIDFGREIEVKQVGIVHDVNARLKECEFELSSAFTFSTVRDGGRFENYSTLSDGNNWTRLLTATDIESTYPEKDNTKKTLWFSADHAVKGRYLKIRPTATYEQEYDSRAVGIREIYVKEIPAESGMIEMQRNEFRCAYVNTMEPYNWNYKDNHHEHWMPSNLFDSDLKTYWATAWNRYLPDEDGWVNQSSGIVGDPYDYEAAINNTYPGCPSPFLYNVYVPNVIFVVDMGRTVKVKAVGIAHDNNAYVRDCEFYVGSTCNFRTAKEVKDAGGSEEDIRDAVDDYRTLDSRNEWTLLLEAKNLPSAKETIHWMQAEEAVEGRYVKIRPTRTIHEDGCALGFAEFRVMIEK